MPLKPWTITGEEELATTRIFKLHRDTAVSPRTGETVTFSRLEVPSWATVMPITTENKIILVRQWRPGVREFTLEVVGGIIEPGEDPVIGAAREAREETGYEGDPPVEIGIVHPNPAVQDNICHTYLIDNARPSAVQDMDAGEDIEIVPTPLADLPGLVANGTIMHTLALSAFWWLRDKRPDLDPWRS
jgi:8-oxo-dGTP pyrophosphatase MutT (NUDIX family)